MRLLSRFLKKLFTCLLRQKWKLNLTVLWEFFEVFMILSKLHEINMIAV